MSHPPFFRLVIGCLALLLFACSEEKKDDANGQPAARTWRVGFSQVTTTEPWRVLFNKEMREEAAKHPEIQLTIADGQDRTEKQVADLESFILQRFDIIIVSPKESAGVTGVVEKAMDLGIPVIVLDRGVATENYTQYIGGDNLKIGRLAGDYAVNLLGGKGKAEGKIVEIWGGMGSTPAQERHKGFAEHLEAEPGIVRLVDRQDGDWKQDRAYNIMAAALKAHPKIDLVYAHNDPMAFGAYLAARDAGREGDIVFLGIDAIPDEGGLWVRQGALKATFVYKTPGAEGIRQALRLLKGEPVEKKIDLETEVVDASNVEAYLAGHGVK
jgi:ribose transport system substrate-binding protein